MMTKKAACLTEPELLLQGMEGWVGSAWLSGRGSANQAEDEMKDIRGLGMLSPRSLIPPHGSLPGAKHSRGLGPPTISSTGWEQHM